jgi:hypothetical protein
MEHSLCLAVVMKAIVTLCFESGQLHTPTGSLSLNKTAIKSRYSGKVMMMMITWKINCPCASWRRTGEWRYSSMHSLTSALDGGEWSASRPDRFTSRKRAPGTHWIGGWVGSRAVLDAVVKEKIPSPRRESNPRTPIVQPVAQRYNNNNNNNNSFFE